MRSLLPRFFSILLFFNLLLVSCGSGELPSPTPVVENTVVNEVTTVPTPTNTEVVPTQTQKPVPQATFPGFSPLQISETRIADKPTELFEIARWGDESGSRPAIYLPSEKILTIETDNPNIRIWDLSTGSLLQEFASGRSDFLGNIISDIRYSPNGEQIALMGGAYAVQVWDVNTGTSIHMFDIANPRDIVDVIYYKDGWKAMIDEGNGLLQIWDLSSNEMMQTLETGQPEIMSVAVSPDGEQVATGSFDGAHADANSDAVIGLWNLTTGEPIQTFSPNTDSVSTIEFSPDGGQLVVYAGDALLAFDIETGELDFGITQLSSFLYIRYLPDSRLIATQLQDHFGIVDAITGETILHLTEADIIARPYFSTDGTLMVASTLDGKLAFWGVP